MRSRLRSLDPRRVALFVAVAAAVSVVVVLAAREAGIGEVPATAAPSAPPAAEDDVAAETTGESLSLTLTAAAICETERGIGGDYFTQIVDDEGNETGWKEEYLGHFNVAETPVRWRVAGGTGPYALVIDGETRDAKRAYAGAVGTASVSCAITTVEPFIFTVGDVDPPKRAYRADPEVDSGLKTIHATVTDAQGDTAEASVDIYVILVNPNVLKRGKTYRVWGRLFTAPLTHDLHTSVYVENECDAASSQRCETEIGFAIEQDGVRANLMLWESDLAESRRWQILSDGTIIEGRNQRPTGAADGDPVDRAFDLALDSKGKAPAVDGKQP